MKKVICILSDALRFDYIEKQDMKFLKEITGKGDCFYVEKIISGLGFCEIVEYVTGKDYAQVLLSHVRCSP